MSEFIAEIKKFGGSLYIKIPKEVIQKLKLKQGELIKVKIWRIKIIVEETQQEQKEKEEDL